MYMEYTTHCRIKGGTSVPTPKQKRKSYITNILIYLLCKNVNTLSKFPNFIPQTSLHFEKKARSVSVTLNVLCICHIELHYCITYMFIQCSSNKTQNGNFRKIYIVLFQCPLACLGFIIPIENFTLIWRRHNNW